MKIKERINVEIDSNTRGRHIVGRVARILLAAVAVFAGSANQVMASAITDNQTRVLPFPNQTFSTIPSDGDVNPYGVAFVPEGFPTGGTLNPGDLLVSNFNNSTNTQGTGTTIIDISSAGQTSVFFQGATGLGLSTGLAVLKTGFVLVANCPTNNNVPVARAAQGSLLLIDRSGNLVNTFVNNDIQGPWDFSVYDQGGTVWVFVSNSITGTVSRIELVFDGGNFSVKSSAVIASGYQQECPDA